MDGPVLLAVGVLGALSACDRVFGTTFEPPVDSTVEIDSDDRPRVPHAGRLVRRQIGDTGQAIVHEDRPYRQSELRPQLFQEGKELPITWNWDTGTFSFDAIEDVPYRIIFDNDAGQPASELFTTSLSPSLVDLRYDRKDAVLPQTLPTISGTFSGPPSPARHVFQSTNVWLELPVALPDASSYLIAWRPGINMVSTSAGDTALIASYQQRNGAFVMTHFDPLTLNMVDGPNSVPTTQRETLPSHCARITAPTSAMVDAIRQTYPTFDAAGYWGIYGVPDASQGPNLAFYLAHSEGAETLQVDYLDPRGGRLDHVVILQAYGSRKHTLGNGKEVTANTFFRQHAKLDTTPCAATTTPTTVVLTKPELQIPQMLRLANRLITEDNLAPPVIGSAKALELTWQSSGADVFDVALYDVTEGVSPEQGLLKLVRYYRSTEPRVLIESRLFDPQKYYLLHVYARRGILDAVSGDLTVATYPHATALGTSAPFQVLP